MQTSLPCCPSPRCRAEHERETRPRWPRARVSEPFNEYSRSRNSNRSTLFAARKVESRHGQVLRARAAGRRSTERSGVRSVRSPRPSSMLPATSGGLRGLNPSMERSTGPHQVRRCFGAKPYRRLLRNGYGFGRAESERVDRQAGRRASCAAAVGISRWSDSNRAVGVC